MSLIYINISQQLFLSLLTDVNMNSESKIFGFQLQDMLYTEFVSVEEVVNVQFPKDVHMVNPKLMESIN